MARRIVFNPLSGAFDLIDVASGFAATTPTEVLPAVTYPLATHTQTLFRRTIILDAGAVISAAADAILIGV